MKKKLEINELVSKGYLQELNRKFLNPLGISLELNESDKISDCFIDHRDNEYGTFLNLNEDDKNNSKERKEFIDNEFYNRKYHRKNKIGSIIETIENSPDKIDEDYLSLLAEFDNYKKRLNSLKENEIQNLTIKLLSPIFELYNDISYAAEIIKNDEDKNGVNLIISKLSSFLNSNNVKEVKTNSYDKDIHDVVSIVYSEENKEILGVVKKGFSLNDKIIIHPKIILNEKYLKN